MVEIIMVSHGDYAKSMLESAQMIVGEQDHVHTFGLHLGDDVDELREQLTEAIEKAQRNGELLVLTDMFSGSPFNITYSLMQYYSFRHITGVNLPLLLEILTSRESVGVDELCKMILDKGKETIIDVNKFLEEMN
ncbi:PTS sugar transporter subunit IIA [Tepidanaerobacter acetatoxydans]|nr:PTS sugar transporter subunit IIA [Tepidanaerobacter acetatoxydans]AEE90478.1 PTS system fructose subfamily IIA component [Tepidanaerobacter acetatoxydans Re1]